MNSCVVLLLDCLVGAVTGIGVIVCFWRLRLPLHLAQTYDAHIDKDGLFSGLPIYGFLRRYLLLMLFAGFVALLVSMVGVVISLLALFKVGGLTCKGFGGISGYVANLVLVIFGIHMTTIACFETDRRHRPASPIKGTVNEVSRRLWGAAAILLVTVGLLYGLAIATSASPV